MTISVRIESQGEGGSTAAVPDCNVLGWCCPGLSDSCQEGNDESVSIVHFENVELVVIDSVLDSGWVAVTIDPVIDEAIYIALKSGNGARRIRSL